MKIHADKIESSTTHALSVHQVSSILKTVPSEWIDGLSEVRLTNALESAPRAFFNRYDKTLTLHCRGCAPKKALELVLYELAAVYHGYDKRHWHRLSTAEKSNIKKVIQPLMDELLPVITQEKKSLVPIATPAFRRIV
jgi:hypothetical protein